MSTNAFFVIALLSQHAIVAHTTTNPTDYGPSPATDSCRPGECWYDNSIYGLTYWVCGGCKGGCDSTSDCSTNVPDGANANDVQCGVLNGYSGVCHLTCTQNSDCGNSGDLCIRDTSSDSAGVCGAFTNTDKCYYVELVNGQWVQIQSSSSEQEVSFQEGVTRTYGVESSSTWGSKVTASVSAKFGVFGIGGSASVTGEISQQFSEQYSSTFAMSSTQTHTFKYGPGVVWQWQFAIQDGCGSATASASDLVLTGGAFAPPCCLPGYSKNISDPTGPCAAGPNLCDMPKASALKTNASIIAV